MAEALALPSLTGLFTTPAALAGVLLLAPILLLYLLRPKPKHILFPSTMFIMFLEKHKRFQSFLQKFIRDPLLVMQLIIVTICVLALANPYLSSLEVIRGREAVAIVIDASASMKATDVGGQRFGSARASAAKIINDLNPADTVSVILAESIPVMALNQGDRKQAVSILSGLKASDTPSNVGDAILLARDVLAGSEAENVIYVISDFAEGDGLDPRLGRRIAGLAGARVEFIQVGGGSDNAGIVSFRARRSVVDEDKLFATASVRNFGEKRNIRMDLYSGGTLIGSQDKIVPGGGEEFYTFSLNITWGEQVIEARLPDGGHLETDDHAYAYVKGVRVSRILLMTGEGNKDRYLRMMLQSLRNVELSVIVPPQPIRDFSDFDVIILGDAESDGILPGTFHDISERVKTGASLITVASVNLWSINDPDLFRMMPVGLTAWGPNESDVIIYEEHDMLRDVVFDNVVARKHFLIVKGSNDTTDLFGTRGESQVPLFSYRRHGAGFVAYMGLNSDPEWSNLYYSSSFPIFWQQMLKQLTPDLEKKNVHDYVTGTYMPLDDVLEVKTPTGASLRTNNVFLDKAGVYEVHHPGKVSFVTVSLLNQRESNITAGSIEDAADDSEFSIEREKIEVRHQYFKWLLAVMLVFLFIEMIMYRRRGLI
ncbi:VWA domain-containing protein [Candidatus Altiarchaeota archaeon]